MSSTQSVSPPTPRLKMTKQEYAGIFIRFLAQNDYKSAARMAWPWFHQNEWSDKIWAAIEKHDRLCIMGHASASKTFTASIWFLLDWIAWADQTALILTSATIPSMDRRIWADFKTLWTKSKVDFSSVASILDAKRMIRQSVSEGKAAIHAVAAESDDAETKIQGMHMPRTRVIIDEADNPYSSSIWPALVNLGSSGHLKWVALANPVDKNSEFGFQCEPPDGWDNIDPETCFEWEGKLGSHILRLDGLDSPNIVAKEDKYRFLLSNTAVAETRESKGVNSPSWWTMIRAFYPPEGLISSIFPGGLVSRCNKPILWYGATTAIAACDPAFEGGDSCVLTIGKMGRVAEKPERTALEANEYIIIKRKNTAQPITHDYGNQIVDILKDRGVDPENFAIDCTGNGLGLSDYIKDRHGLDIMSVAFGASPSGKKMTSEDTMVARDRFKNFVTELWYASREWCRLGLVYIKNAPRDLRIQLESRRYEIKGKHAKSGREIIVAETKLQMKARGLTSPDFGDSFCLLCNLVRSKSLGFIPGTFVDETPSKSKKRFTKNASVWTMNYGVEDKE